MDKLERLYNLAIQMNENPDEPVTLKNTAGKEMIVQPKKMGKVFAKQLHAFMYEFNGYKKNGAELQAFMGSSDLPRVTKDVFNVTQQTNNFDLFWSEAFRTVRLTPNQLDWEIDTVNGKASFIEIPEGSKIEYKRFTGSQITAKVKKYGMGIGVSWETITGRKLYKFINQMEDARSKLFELWGNVHYTLLATASLSNTVIWEGQVTDPVLSRDIATLNKGYTTIGDNTKDSGYGDTANARMILYVSPNLKARINQALRATSADITSGRRDGVAGSVDGQIVEFNIDVRYTYNSNIPANKGVLVLPGNKIQNATKIQQLELSRREIESLNELKVYWTAFGAYIADNNQTAELSFA